MFLEMFWRLVRLPLLVLCLFHAVYRMLHVCFPTVHNLIHKVAQLCCRIASMLSFHLAKHALAQPLPHVVFFHAFSPNLFLCAFLMIATSLLRLLLCCAHYFPLYVLSSLNLPLSFVCFSALRTTPLCMCFWHYAYVSSASPSLIMYIFQPCLLCVSRLYYHFILRHCLYAHTMHKWTASSMYTS